MPAVDNVWEKGRAALSAEDAITHSPRSENANIITVRVRRDSLGPGTTPPLNAHGAENRVYLRPVAARSGSVPLLRSSLGPTASHFRAEGPRQRERSPPASGQTFPARCHFLSPQPCCQSRRRRAGRPVDTFKNCILNYTPPRSTLFPYTTLFRSWGYFRRTKYDCAV